MKISSATVRRLRTEHGWSQEQLAAVSGISLRTVQRVEGEGTASLETRASLAAAFGVRFEELVETPLQAPPAQRYKIAAIIAGIVVFPRLLLFWVFRPRAFGLQLSELAGPPLSLPSFTRHKVVAVITAIVCPRFLFFWLFYPRALRDQAHPPRSGET